jgi:hypothetical protein
MSGRRSSRFRREPDRNRGRRIGQRRDGNRHGGRRLADQDRDRVLEFGAGHRHVGACALVDSSTVSACATSAWDAMP